MNYGFILKYFHGGNFQPSVGVEQSYILLFCF